MRITRERAIGRESDNHRHSPWVSTKNPIESRGFVFTVVIVAGHLPIQVCLGGKTCHEVRRAPDERNADEKAISGACDHQIEPLLIESHHLCFLRWTSVSPDLKVTVVVPWKPLIVIRRVLAHPWSDRLFTRVRHCIVQELTLTSYVKKCGGAELHVV